MKKQICSLVFICTIVMTRSAVSFETSTPEAQGISSSAIIDFIEAAEAEVDALHSFMLLRHGKIVAQGWWAPYSAEHPHVLYSLSKSFTSTAIGLAIAEGLLSLDDTVISFFPDETPENPGNNLKSMRIRDLLAMNSGHEEDTTGRITSVEGKTWVEAFLSLTVEHKPGTHFVYNSGATFMLSAILQKVSGETVLDFLTPRLFQPLGIEKPTWENNPQGINTGGWGLKVKTKDIARLGQLYLQKGVWNGQRILTEAWVDAASARQTSNGSNPESDWEQGYGYQFWRCRHNAYRGDGAFGQYCIVLPEQDAVLAITSGLGDMQKPLNLVWDILLPAMGEKALPEDKETDKKLQNKLANLQLRTVSGEPDSETAKKISGRTFVFEPSIRDLKSVSFDFVENRSTIHVQAGSGERLLDCGFKKWIPNQMPLMNANPEPVAVCGAWIKPDHYRIKIAGIETPYIQTLNFLFQGEELLFDLEYNVSFGERKWGQIRAKLKQ